MAENKTASSGAESEDVSGINFFAEADELKNSGATLHLKSVKTGEPLYFGKNRDKPVTITLRSKDSEEFLAGQRAIANRRIQAGARGASTVTAERLDSESAENLAKATESWQGIADEKGALECNFTNAKRLYMQHREIREQVDTFIAERSNFLAG